MPKSPMPDTVLLVDGVGSGALYERRVYNADIIEIRTQLRKRAFIRTEEVVDGYDVYRLMGVPAAQIRHVNKFLVEGGQGQPS